MDLSNFFDYSDGDTALDSNGEEVFLANLPEDEWARILSVAQHRTFRQGDILIRSGEVSRTFFIVAKGRLEVFAEEAKGKERHIIDVEPMSIFGEQAFFDGLPRSASVRAHSDGELFSISTDGFEVLAARHPELGRTMLFDLARILSLRLRSLTRLMLDARF